MKPSFFFLFLLALFGSSSLSSQDFKLSRYATVSILHCEPGSELYSSFGHSAIRIQDPILDLDLIYNYGIFDFYAPGFYTNFVNGKLTYSLGRQYFSDFIFEYDIQERGVVEQVLDLGPSEKNALLNFLEKNYLPENREYAYDFLYDNCATKIRDLLEDKSLFPGISRTNLVAKSDKSFRDLISEKLAPNNWPLFGINMLLGAVVDKKTSWRDAQFLPEYLHKQMEDYSIRGLPLVASESQIITPKKTSTKKIFLWKTPAFWSILILFITIASSLFEYFGSYRFSWFNRSLFFISGTVSLLLIYLWFFSDHATVVNNYNLLWASPLCLILFGYSFKKQNKRSSLVASIFFLCLLATPIVHLIGLQKLDLLFFPIIASLAIRTLPLLYKKTG